MNERKISCNETDLMEEVTLQFWDKAGVGLCFQGTGTAGRGEWPRLGQGRLRVDSSRNFCMERVLRD